MLLFSIQEWIAIKKTVFFLYNSDDKNNKNDCGGE
jgi:hypothetical protein